MVKILHVAETIKGGVATVLRQLTKDTECFDILCIVPEDQKSEIKNVSAGVNTFVRTGRNWTSFLNLAKKFIGVYRKQKPDIIHIHSSFAGFICRAILFFLPGHPKVIYCPHAFSFLMDSSELKKNIYAFVERVLARKTDVIVCVSKYEHDEAIKRGLDERKLKIIYNGVEKPEDIIVEDDTSDEQSSDILNILFVGRIDYQKGFDIVEQVAKKIGDKCKVVVVGGGVHSNPELYQAENIIYAGWVSKENMASYYLNADVLLMPSRWESFGLVAVEAQSYGLPVVASRCSSLPEVVQEGCTGFLFPVGDVNEACRILLSLDKVELREMQYNAIDFYKNNFTSEKMVEQTYKLYRD
ncbi:glycosyltransferase [Serratia entomophila]|uniref:glycosyltransferase n=1 Tax=Serratia entomophila TaxID=42906 RepID=UPI002179C18A|nr:glycosyltransferase [Serratia entomophila]CAI1121321.1 D-inositol-3-phosphate glycosyltransferase [Serratia entomophila]CAI1833241.1 D-inositol-3-phosphate glycosyltransferase [Serratia entomophila]CAI1853689.1 D-inositol-3-phosphate glycosyltransferase [Serratia entomophila]CAI1901743.1 D-inositol-3-phosphate glycosyltransferase [Serratia entomophila]CAI1933974.1 D-inositol-3-phosphate glycosyltransferase [Serratia entomophila]